MWQILEVTSGLNRDSSYEMWKALHIRLRKGGRQH